MAARDIFVLDSSLGARLICLLYGLALILIALMVILGLVRGVSLMSRAPMPRPAVADNAATTATAAPGAAQPQPPQPGMQQRRFAERRMIMMRLHRPRAFDPLRFGPVPRNPMLGGLAVIVGTLIRGAIMVMVVRILAELGLAVLAMPRRSEI